VIALKDTHGISSLVLGAWSDSKAVALLGARVFCFTNSVFEGLMNCQLAMMRSDRRGMSYIFELLLELVKFLSVDQACFVVDVFGDVEAAVLFVDFADDGFDRGVALDQGSFGKCWSAES
jgi:hypothetical protein